MRPIATRPIEPVSTDDLTMLAGFPAGPPRFCNLPQMIPTQAVATSVAIGPVGAYCAGGLNDGTVDATINSLGRAQVLALP